MFCFKSQGTVLLEVLFNNMFHWMCVHCALPKEQNTEQICKKSKSAYIMFHAPNNCMHTAILMTKDPKRTQVWPNKNVPQSKQKHAHSDTDT